MVFFYYLKINYEDQWAFFWVKLLGEVDKLLYSITFAVLDVLSMLTNSPCKFRDTLKPKFLSNRGNPPILLRYIQYLVHYLYTARLLSNPNPDRRKKCFAPPLNCTKNASPPPSPHLTLLCPRNYF